MTVSRALSKPDVVSSVTRRKVEEAAAQLGYVPNLTAMALITKRSGMIGALMTTITNPILATTIEKLQQGLAAKGYHLLIGETVFSHDQETHLLRAFLGRQLDGLILAYGYHNEETLALLRGADIPVVELWDLPEGPLPRQPVGHVVGFSNWAAGLAAGHHLVEQGYKRPGFFGFDDEREECRWQGFRQAVLEGLGIEPFRFKTSPIPSLDDGTKVIELYIRNEIPCDSLFFTNDMQAIGALYSCQRQDIKVPQTLGICGFGDLPIAHVSAPSLTSVRIPADKVASLTVELLDQQIRGEEVTTTPIDVGCELIARESTRKND